MSFLQRILSRFRPPGKASNNEDIPDVQSIERRGWRQWSCVSQADLAAVLTDAWSGVRGSGTDGSRLLVVTQDCDLVHHSLDNEPTIEAYICNPLPSNDQVDGNQTAGKNPRSLVVKFSVDGEDRWFRVRSNGKTLFPRDALSSLDPDQSVVIRDDAAAILQRWLINRIVRTAFPDAFNERTTKARKKMERQLKRGGEQLLGLYINLTPQDELPAGQAYSIDLIGLVPEGIEIPQRQEIETMLGQIAVAYEKSDGVESCEYQVMDDGEFTYSLLRTHRLFPLDYLSLSGKPGGELPPPG